MTDRRRRPAAAKPNLLRVIRLLFRSYPKLVPISICCTVFSAIVATVPAVLQQKILASVERWYSAENGWNSASGEIVPAIIFLALLYIASLAAVTAYTQLNSIITQGFLSKVRKKMFGGMQYLPIRYFDTHKHGDIMSHYTNDIDTLRQLVSQTFPQFISSGTIVLCVTFIMLYYSVWMTLIVALGVVAMLIVSRKVGGGSARFFIRQQKALGQVEGFAQEMMSGQKVVKVFCHEEKSQQDFDRLNEELNAVSYKAHAYANALGPIIMNIGNILYVVSVVAGGLFLLGNVPNVSLSGLPFSIDIVVPFLGMCKQFTGNINGLSQQINSLVMALAGAERIFSLMDEPAETDDGYVTLVDAEIGPDGSVTEADHHTGHWAWKHPHTDGSGTTYTPLRGDVRMVEVDFAYEEGKDVLHDVTVYAEPGQKVAFVGATGAGKTTITNLINRFYDIADGKIRYDGININKIHKPDLRRSLGVVLQDVNLFTGTVMDNIRYGKLDATDEEVMAAAKAVHAHDFIMQMPKGYQTEVSERGSSLSVGQRQLISFARALLNDPKILILDEATSSIDTHTEILIQKALDVLLRGRTSFVIAHRLSTIRNADCIMVIQDGHVAEAGTHDELIRHEGGHYKALCDAQYRFLLDN